MVFSSDQAVQVFGLNVLTVYQISELLVMCMYAEILICFWNKLAIFPEFHGSLLYLNSQSQ